MSDLSALPRADLLPSWGLLDVPLLPIQPMLPTFNPAQPFSLSLVNSAQPAVCEVFSDWTSLVFPGTSRRCAGCPAVDVQPGAAV
jgi:hypothetical protein